MSFVAWGGSSGRPRSDGIAPVVGVPKAPLSEQTPSLPDPDPAKDAILKMQIPFRMKYLLDREGKDLLLKLVRAYEDVCGVEVLT